MPLPETESNPGITSGDKDLISRLDHIDVQLHEIRQLLEPVIELFHRHRPALERAAALASPGAGLRALMGLPAPKKKAQP